MCESKHNHEPLPFGRRVKGCPRCEALASGAEKPREGWGARKAAQERALTAEIRGHYLPGGGCKCGPNVVVCTRFDW